MNRDRGCLPRRRRIPGSRRSDGSRRGAGPRRRPRRRPHWPAACRRWPGPPASAGVRGETHRPRANLAGECSAPGTTILPGRRQGRWRRAGPGPASSAIRRSEPRSSAAPGRTVPSPGPATTGPASCRSCGRRSGGQDRNGAGLSRFAAGSPLRRGRAAGHPRNGPGPRPNGDRAPTPGLAATDRRSAASGC